MITSPIKLEEEKAKKRWDSIAKPLGSLGRLEEAVIRLAGISGDARVVSVKKAGLVIMCADHGVVEEGVTQTGYEVTNIVATNFTKGNTSVNAMADTIGVDIFPVDIGMNSEPVTENEPKPFHLLNRKIARGSSNFVKQPAMTLSQCEMAIQVGIDMVRDLKSQGYEILATGEMGIGNTTPSSALTAVLLQQEVEAVTGRGAGLSNTSLERKIQAIKLAIARYKEAEELRTKELRVEPSNTEPSKEVLWVLNLLSELGGYDIAGLVGVFLGGAIYKVPILIDGFISSVAALVAVRMEEKVRSYVFASHESKEPAGRMVLEALQLKPFIICDMYLGEGTGAIAVLPLLSMAIEVYTRMSTFQDIQIEEYKQF